MATTSLPSTRTSRHVLWLVIASTLLLGVGMSRRPVQLNGDFTASYLTWQQWHQGAPFHSSATLDTTDIAHDHFQFLSWWSPGTYLGPAMLESTGLTLGAAIALCLVILYGFGFTGWRQLFLRFGFSDRVTAWSLFLMFLGWHTLYPFRIYHGGEVVTFALFPWLVCAVLAAPAGAWSNLPVVAGLTFVGAMGKLSFLITALALTAVIVLRVLKARPPLAEAIRLSIPATLGYLLGAGLVQILMLGKGGNPGTAGLVPVIEQMNLPQALAAGVGLPAKALFSLTSITPYIDHWLGWPEESARLGWLLGAVVLMLPLYRLAWRFGPAGGYRQALFTVAGFTTAALAWLYFRHAAVSDEDRHARLIALLLLPGVVSAASGATRGIRVVLVLALAAAASWGVLSLAHHWTGGVQRGATSWRGIAYWELRADDLSAVQAADRAVSGSSVLWLTSIDELALELPGRRVRNVQPLLRAANRHEAVRGRVEHVFILVSPGSEARAVAEALTDLTDLDPSGWRIFVAGGRQIFYHGPMALPLPAPSP